jgi:acyl-CoA reductase-like NAD-dependent aldehyde dehydrogenase
MGDPREEEVFIGPMISEKEASRLEDWINEATKLGGKILTGGKRQGAMLEATLMEDVPKDAKLNREEAFGPVAVLSKFTSFKEALQEVNDSRFGLQAGIFTRDIHKAHLAWDLLEVGGVVIGDIPSWRADQMPYGGVKDSGLGREGIRYAMEDMSEIRLMVLRQLSVDGE